MANTYRRSRPPPGRRLEQRHGRAHGRCRRGPVAGRGDVLHAEGHRSHAVDLLVAAADLHEGNLYGIKNAHKHLFSEALDDDEPVDVHVGQHEADDDDRDVDKVSLAAVLAVFVVLAAVPAILLLSAL